MHRREAIRRITAVLGGTLSAPTLAGLLAGCEAQSGRRRYTPRTLSVDELDRVRAIAELIIPETDTPGAAAPRVDEFVDMMITDFYPNDLRAHFLAELARVDSISQSLVGKTFDDASDGERQEILATLDRQAFPDPSSEPERAAQMEVEVARGEPPFMRTMKELTVAGYYTSEIGQTEELHIPPFGTYQGDVPYDRIGLSWA